MYKLYHEPLFRSIDMGKITQYSQQTRKIQFAFYE